MYINLICKATSRKKKKKKVAVGSAPLLKLKLYDSTLISTRSATNNQLVCARKQGEHITPKKQKLIIFIVQNSVSM